MKRFLVIGAIMIMVAASLLHVADAGMKDISTNKFSEGTVEDPKNVTVSEVVIGDGLYNDGTKLLIHNNATYSYISMDLKGGPDSYGNYPENVLVDLGSNKRIDYKFTGPGVGAWGKQTFGFNKEMKPSKVPELYPSEEGHKAYVKLPSKATVSSFDFNISHPPAAVRMEKLLSEKNLKHYGMTYIYLYQDEEPTYNSWYYDFTNDYYPMKYVQSHSYMRDGPQSWTSYWYGYSNQFGPLYMYDYINMYGYRWGDGFPEVRIYMQWDMESPDLMVPDGATITSYTLNYPIKQNYGYAPYGYSFSSETKKYFSGEKEYGVFALTDEPFSNFNYNDRTYGPYRNAYAYYSSSKYSLAGKMDKFNSVFTNVMPTNRTTPAATYKMSDSYSDSSTVIDYNINYNLINLVNEWRSGTLQNYGILMNMYKTPYSTAPHLYDYYHNYYVTYNSNFNSGSKYDRNHVDFYRTGGWTTPFTTSGSWTALRPKLIIEYKAESINPWLDVCDDGTTDFSFTGSFEGERSLGGYQSAVNTYLRTHLPDEVDEYGNEWTYVPIRVGADTAGRIIIQNISVKYDYTAKVFYNPTSGTLLKELNTVVPRREDGLTMVPLNVSASSKGKVTFSNLELRGTKPNYRPSVPFIEDINVPEGSNNQRFLALSDLFYDEDQPSETLTYKVQKNDQPNHVDLKIYRSEARNGKVYLWVDTSKDPDWFGTVRTQISATDMYGKDTWTNVFGINILPVNDPPVLGEELPMISAEEGLDTLLIEYTAPTGRDIAQGKRAFYFRADGKPYFYDLEGQRIYLDFELLGPDMEPQYLERTTEDGFRIYRGLNNEVSLYVLPPEYTDDPDNFVIVIGSGPDYSSNSGTHYHLKIYTSDDKNDRRSQSYQMVPIIISSVNDPPVFSPIPDVNMDEDTVYTGFVKFIDTYVHDVDNSTEDLTVEIISANPSVKVFLNDAGYLRVEPEMDYSGVVQVLVKASDGIFTVSTTFNVRVRSMNDKPVAVVSNIYNGKTIDSMFYIRGTGNDKEKTLRWIEVAIIKAGDILYEDEWKEAEGAYVWQYLVDIREYSDGEHNIYIRAYDGRDYSDVLTFTVMIDSPETKPLSAPPVVAITTSISGRQSEKLTIEGTAQDDSNYVEYVEFRVDGGTWRKAAFSGSAWTAVIDTRTLTNEIHNFTVRAFDGKLYSDVAFKRFEVYNEDSDLDGIPNDIEILLGMDPFNKLDGRMDFDLDGFLNVDEIKAKTDPFDANSHPKIKSDEPVLEIWAIIFIAVAVIMTVLIIGLFLLNIQMEKNIHAWREEAHSKRAQKRPKTLLQKIVELAPTYVQAAPTGPALPTGQTVEQRESLPPAPNEKN